MTDDIPAGERREVIRLLIETLRKIKQGDHNEKYASELLVAMGIMADRRRQQRDRTNRPLKRYLAYYFSINFWNSGSSLSPANKEDPIRIILIRNAGYCPIPPLRQSIAAAR
jgi:hypothetical protein